MKDDYNKFFILLSFLVFGCRAKEIGKLEIRQVYIQGVGFGINNHELNTYHHILILKEYDGRDGWSHDFIDFTDKYRDTLINFIPASEITICKPFQLEKGSLDDNTSLIQKNAIISITYTNETLDQKFPDIWGITFYDDGKSFDVNLSTIDRRKQSESYNHHDSSGNDTYDWIDSLRKHVSPDSSKEFH